MSLAHFGYNLKRALAVVGLEKLLAALKDFQPGGRASAPVTAAMVDRANPVATGMANVKKVWHRWLESMRGGIIFARP